MPDERLWGIAEAGTVNVGDVAPDFELPALIAGVKKGLRLSANLAQKSVVLAFYPFNWQEASARQLADYQAQRARLLALNAETVAITTDSIMNMTAWEREIGPFEFPLCVDFWPHGEVSRRYGVLRESGPEAGASERAIFIVDRGGRVAFRKVYAPDEVAPVDDVFAALEKL
jgi:peroxiredoxin